MVIPGPNKGLEHGRNVIALLECIAQKAERSETLSIPLRDSLKFIGRHDLAGWAEEIHADSATVAGLSRELRAEVKGSASRQALTDLQTVLLAAPQLEIPIMRIAAMLATCETTG